MTIVRHLRLERCSSKCFTTDAFVIDSFFPSLTFCRSKDLPFDPNFKPKGKDKGKAKEGEGGDGEKVTTSIMRLECHAPQSFPGKTQCVKVTDDEQQTRHRNRVDGALSRGSYRSGRSPRPRRRKRLIRTEWCGCDGRLGVPGRTAREDIYGRRSRPRWGT